MRLVGVDVSSLYMGTHGTQVRQTNADLVRPALINGDTTDFAFIQGIMTISHCVCYLR